MSRSPHSLHRQLLLWLLLPQLVLWAAGGWVTYNVAATYANRAIDASLSQATRALARQVKPIGNGLFIDFPRAAQDVLEADPADRVYYMVSTPPGQFILGNRTLPAPPPPAGDPRLNEPRFYDGEMPVAAANGQAAPQRVRVAALYLTYGDDETPQLMLVQVARSSANREELARNLLVDTLLPLSGLIALMTMIVWAGIRAGLAPLTRLRALVEGKAPNDLAPIRLEAAPAEVRGLAGAVNALLVAVQHNVQGQKRFIADAAHQLRTPLAGLKSQTELALAEATEPALRARLQRVHESATRSAHLVSQLLVLARAEPESAAAQGRSVFDLRRLAEELTAELVPRALQAGIDLGFDEGSEQPVWVRGNALLLREALVNLVDNALRYAGRNAVVTVRVAALPGGGGGGGAEGGGWAQAVVEDNGPGVPEEDRERVLERFFRGTTEGNGCGLGLAIVREIVERHAGSVRLEGATPRGLRVIVRLPLAPAGAPTPKG